MTVDLSSHNIDELIDSIINKVDEKSIPYLRKYDKEWLIEILNGEKLQTIENKFKEYDKRCVDIVDFVKIFLTCFDHQDHETIYIVISLIEFFKTMLESLGLDQYVKFTHFTNFIVEV